MPGAGNYYVITLHGDRGPMNRASMAESLRAGEIAGTDRVRNAFGRPLGTVADLLSSESGRNAAARTSARGRAPAMHQPSGPSPKLVAGVVVALVVIAVVALAVLLKPAPEPAPSAPVQPVQPPRPVQPPKAPTARQTAPVPVAQPAEGKPGLLVAIFRLNFSPEDFPFLAATAKPDWSGTVDGVQFETCTKAGFSTTFYARWQGRLEILKPGRFTFFLNSDDGSRLAIDDKVVVDNGGSHGMQERSGACELTAGSHVFRVEFFQGEGPAGIELTWQPDGAERGPVPAALLSH